LCPQHKTIKAVRAQALWLVFGGWGDVSLAPQEQRHHHHIAIAIIDNSPFFFFGG
jgi:hypothetical protein